jgi:hypothetical protein
MSNEIMNTNNQENYEITKTENGKFQRKTIYKPFSSVVAETKEQKIAMINLLSEDSEAQPLKSHIGHQIELADVIFQPYDKLNEETGEIEFGVVTYLIDQDGLAFVTSSKSVYHTLKKFFVVFGEPHYNADESITVQIVERNGRQHKYVDLKLIG